MSAWALTFDTDYFTVSYLAVALDRPSLSDVESHKFHTTMARLFLSQVDALIGYKYANGAHNNDLDEDIWIRYQYQKGVEEPLQHRILPKRLSEPLSRVLALIEELQLSPSDSNEMDDPAQSAND